MFGVEFLLKKYSPASFENGIPYVSVSNSPYGRVTSGFGGDVEEKQAKRLSSSRLCLRCKA